MMMLSVPNRATMIPLASVPRMKPAEPMPRTQP